MYKVPSLAPLSSVCGGYGTCVVLVYIISRACKTFLLRYQDPGAVGWQ